MLYLSSHSNPSPHHNSDLWRNVGSCGKAPRPTLRPQVLDWEQLEEVRNLGELPSSATEVQRISFPRLGDGEALLGIRNGTKTRFAIQLSNIPEIRALLLRYQDDAIPMRLAIVRKDTIQVLETMEP